jgi:hypothetical protein
MQVPRKMALPIGLAYATLGALFLIRTLAPEIRPPVAVPIARSRAEAQRQDIAYLGTIAALDRAFPPEQRKTLSNDLEELNRHAGEMNDAAFEVGVAHALALARNGHTNAQGVAFSRNLPTLPLRVAWFADGLFVVRAAPVLNCALGARILAINSRAPQDMLDLLRPLIGGTRQFAKLLSVNLLVTPAVLHALDASVPPDNARISLAQSHCAQSEFDVAASARPSSRTAQENRWPTRDLSPVREPEDQNNFQHALDGHPTPLYLRSPDIPYWSARLGADLLYVQLRRIRDVGTVSLPEFARSTVDAVRRERTRYVVVDLRASPGGNSNLLFTFSRQLPQAVAAEGKVFVLIGPNTFSAAIITAARLKYYGGAHTLLIGEDMGDSGRFWSDGGRATLPNSHIVISYARYLQDWSNGCSLAQLGVCYWADYFHGVAAGDLSPTIRLPETSAAYFAGRDTVMEQVQKLIDTYARQPASPTARLGLRHALGGRSC